jgi:hypothetical protein
MKLQKYDAEIGCFLNSRLHCKGGGSKTTSTTAPNPAQTAILNKQLDIANRLDAQGDLNYYPGQTLASENALVGIGQQGQIDLAQSFNNNLSPDIMAATQRGLNADLVNDPRTEALAQAVTRPMEQQFQESTLPSIGSAAVSQGAFGGDRQNILTNQATRDFNQNIGDTRAKIFADAQRTGMSQQLNMLSQLPSIQQGMLTPSQLVSDVGQQQQGGQQAIIDDARARFEFGEFAPTDTAQRVNSILSGINFGQNTTSKTGGGGGGLLGK